MKYSWGNDELETTTHFPIHVWRWEVGRTQRRLWHLVDTNFSRSQIQCTLSVNHEFLVFSTVYLKATGKWRDVDELGRLLEDMR